MDTKTMIRELESVEEKHKHDKVFTGQINIATMAHDVRKRLEELKPYEDTGLTPEQIRELKEALSRENTQETARLSRDNDGWIPVQDKLPEDDVDVLITYADIDDEIYTDICITTYGYAYLGGNKLDFKEWRSPFEYFRSNYKVIAWQPLPEPYRPERSRENEK